MLCNGIVMVDHRYNAIQCNTMLHATRQWKCMRVNRIYQKCDIHSLILPQLCKMRGTTRNNDDRTGWYTYGVDKQCTFDINYSPNYSPAHNLPVRAKDGVYLGVWHLTNVPSLLLSRCIRYRVILDRDVYIESIKSYTIDKELSGLICKKCLRYVKGVLF